MNKYQLVNEKWIVKSAQQQGQQRNQLQAPTADSVEGTSSWWNPGTWFGGGDGTSFRTYVSSNGVEKGKKLMEYVYGPGYSGEGKFMKELRDAAKLITYLDMDFDNQVENIAEDLDEVREANIKILESSISAIGSGAGRVSINYQNQGQNPAGGKRGKRTLILD